MHCMTTWNLETSRGHCCGIGILKYHETEKQDILKRPREDGNMKAKKKAKLL